MSTSNTVKSIRMCIPCKPHAFQDERYGKNHRVHTTCQGSENKARKSHCTVCGKQHEHKTRVI